MVPYNRSAGAVVIIDIIDGNIYTPIPADIISAGAADIPVITPGIYITEDKGDIHHPAVPVIRQAVIRISPVINIPARYKIPPVIRATVCPDGYIN